MPDNNPVPLTVATVAGLLLHTPPAEGSPSAVTAPAHTLPDPVIAAGDGFTLTGLVTVHPDPNEYVIVVAPVAIPVTIPLSEPIVPTATLLLLQAPPATGSLRPVVSPAHTVDAPTIAVGALLTVTVIVVAHPVGKV